MNPFKFNLSSNMISLFALIFSMPSLYFSIRNYIKSRPNIKFTESENHKNSFIVEPEFDSQKYDLDIYQNFRYRLLIELTIKNTSSNSITIISAKLNKYFNYGPYNSYTNKYVIETKTNKHQLKKGTFAFTGETEKIKLDLTNKIIKMPLYLKPYEAVKGYIVFPIKENDLKYINLYPSSNNLKIETTFKPFDCNVYIKREKIITRDKYLSQNENWD